LFFLIFVIFLSSRIVINEFLYDAIGDEPEGEWIELYNTSSTPVDISGWRIEWGGSSFGGDYTFTIESGTVPAFGYFLIENTEDATPVKADYIPSDWIKGIQNGGNDAVGIRIAKPIFSVSDIIGSTFTVNGTTYTVIDTVIYGGETNSKYQLPDDNDTPCPDSEIAPDAPPGYSLSRKCDGYDTDNSYNDFIITVPSPENSFYSGEKIKEIVVYPNPFNLSKYNSVNILPPEDMVSTLNLKIKIYTLKGDLIRELDNGEWDGKDRYGRRVSPGVYIIFYKTERGKARGKVTVIR